MESIQINSLWAKFRLVVIFASYIFVAGSVKADDIEIYLANADIEAVNPNILFVMDTSGSMSLRPLADIQADNDVPAKIEQMKAALAQIVGTLNNVNVGLMRFSAYETQNIYEAGGPILYPVRDINAAVDPLVYSYINSSSDDGVETPAGGVVLDQATISMVNDGIDCPDCRISTFIPLTGDDNIILGVQTNPPLAVLGQDGDYLGLRYQVDIPQGATIFSAQIRFTAAANNSDAKYSEPLRMSHDWRRANYDLYPADTDPFVNGVQLDNSDSANLSGVGVWHGYRKWNDEINPNPQDNSSGSLVPVFVEGNEYTSNTLYSVSWSIARPEWDSGDHIMYRFYREKENTVECTDNAVAPTECGTAPIVELVAGYLPPVIPEHEECADAVCESLCTAPIIELEAGYLPPVIPEHEECADAVCESLCTAPIIELEAGYLPPVIPAYEECADAVCESLCTAPIIELEAGYLPPVIPEHEECADPVCTDLCTAPIIELEAGYWPDPIPVDDTCIPNGEGGEICFPNDPIQPPFVDPVFGPDPDWSDADKIFADPVCEIIPEEQPPFVDPVFGPDPDWSDADKVFADPVCEIIPEEQPPFVDPVFGPDPDWVPGDMIFAAPVCEIIPEEQPPFVDPVFGPDPDWSDADKVFADPVCEIIPEEQPPFVDPVFGPQPDYEAIYTPIQDFSPIPAVRNAHGLQSGTPPILEVVWLPDDSDQKIALRFDEVFVPQGATIKSAFIEFETIASSVDTDLDIYAELADDSAPLVVALSNIGSRTKTLNHADWDGVIDWTSVSNDHKTTPNIANVVEEVVARGGWCSGNAMTFILSGSGSRKFKSWDYGSGAVPRLKIRYDDSSVAVGACNTQQAVTSIASVADDKEEVSAFNTSGVLGLSVHNGGTLPDATPFTIDNYGYLDTTNFVGYRFQNVNVPKDAIITSAYLWLTSKNTQPNSAAIDIKGIAADDFLPWTNTDFELTTQPLLTPSVAWDIGEWQVDRAYKSADISSIIQAIVNRGGWDEGNALGLITSAASSATTHSAYSSDFPEFAPKLFISYESSFEEGSRTVRDELLDLVTGLTAQGSTPISGVLAEAASYYRGEDVYFGENRGFAPDDTLRRYYRTSHPESFSGGTRNLPAGCYDSESSIKECHAETITGSPEYVSPIADICQTNNIVLLSDGLPNNNFSETQGLIEPIIEGDGNLDDGFEGYDSCEDVLDGIDCSLKLAEAIANEDQETATFNGIQTVETHTIGFDLASGGDAAEFLVNLAKDGEGGSYLADDAGSLAAVLQAIIDSLEIQSRTFVSAGVSVDQSTRLTHRDELYFGLFNPDTDTEWDGNLKRYRLIDGAIHDSASIAAVDENGRFKDLAQSFWSDEVDGDEVAVGGAAGEMTNSRNIYSNITGDPLTNDNNKIHEDNVNILEADLAATDAANREAILRWARGIDGAGNARLEMGDALHSTPIVAIYDDGAASTQVFVGTNQGYLHAIDTESGAENWSFVPKVLLENLTLFENNTVLANHVYGLDGNLSIYHDDTDHDSMIDAGETAILYVGMRRGGRNYYAIDISERLTPTLRFVIEGGSANYAELGQSWSKPTFGRINFNGSPRDVLVFGGGYDTNQDIIGVHLDDTVGRTVYIVDALTGAKLWDARSNVTDPLTGTSAMSNLSNSIPANIKAIDLSGSGFIEHIYAADTAGQVFRFDVDNFGNSGAADLIVGGRLAHLQTGAAVEENNRRFFYAPDVSVIKRPNYEDFVAVSIGSGYRAHPVSNGVNDRFYVIRDSWILDNKTFPVLPGDVDEDDLADVSTIIGDANTDGISDALALIENPGTPKQGWFVDFLQTGEKVLSESITFDEKIIFSTYHPSLDGIGTDVCEAPEGSGRAYILNIIDGTPAVDNNTDGDLLDLTYGDPDSTTCGDRCFALGRGIPSNPVTIIRPEGATLCFGTECFDDLLTFQGERLQRVKWRRR